MFNNYGPRQNPRYVTGTIITQALTRPEIELGALDPLRDFCFCTDGVRGHLMVAAHGIPATSTSTARARTSRWRDWADLILRTGAEHGLWPDDRHIVTVEGRKRPGLERRDGAPRRPREAHARDGLAAEGVAGRRASSGRSAGTPRTATAGSAASTGSPPARRSSRRHVSRVLVTGGGGFLGSHLVERLEADGHDVVAARRRRLRPDVDGRHRAAVRRRASPSSSSTSPRRSAASARTAPTRAATGTRT